MESNRLADVRNILDQYLDTSHHRKTPERYAILDAIYSIKGLLTLEQIDKYLNNENFRVSRATLYNTMRLFIRLRLVIRHRLQGGTKYEACYNNDNLCHQICTVCGKVTEIKIAEITTAVDNIKLRRFHKDSFSLYIYGICSSCQAKITRRKAAIIKQRKTKKQ